MRHSDEGTAGTRCVDPAGHRVHHPYQKNGYLGDFSKFWRSSGNEEESIERTMWFGFCARDNFTDYLRENQSQRHRDTGVPPFGSGCEKTC